MQTSLVCPRFYNLFSATSEARELRGGETGANLQTTGLPNIVSEEREEVGGIGRFMADGQDPTMICKLAERIDAICTRDEQALYMAVQQKPIANFSPDAVVLTNRRAIVFRQKVLGRLQFHDVPWLNVADVHMAENIVGSTLTIRGVNGHVESVSHLPKPQARKVYRIAQDMEERLVEMRRQRAMEERKAGAMNVVVNNDLGAIVARPETTTNEEPVVVLARLKEMLDAGLISHSEYEAKKQEILGRM